MAPYGLGADCGGGTGLVGGISVVGIELLAYRVRHDRSTFRCGGLLPAGPNRKCGREIPWRLRPIAFIFAPFRKICESLKAQTLRTAPHWSMQSVHRILRFECQEV